MRKRDHVYSRDLRMLQRNVFPGTGDAGSSDLTGVGGDHVRTTTQRGRQPVTIPEGIVQGLQANFAAH
jgi:hypothetical protein